MILIIMLVESWWLKPCAAYHMRISIKETYLTHAVLSGGKNHFCAEMNKGQDE